MNENNIYYNLDKILSYNAFLNFIIGERGVGKTYSTSKFVTKQFLKKGYEFIYIRRFKSELKEGLDDFYDSLIKNDEFKNHEFKRKGNELLIDNKTIGYGLTLTQAQTIKGSNFPNVKYILFDEFLLEDDGHHHYLKNEVKMFLSMIESIGRMRDELSIFCLGNSTSIYNPYFLYWNIEQPYKTDIKLYKNGLILVQIIENLKYREQKKKTRFGQLTSGTDYEQFALYNKFDITNNDFIEHKSSSAKCSFCFKYQDKTYGVWYDYNLGKIFVSNDCNSNLIFATTKDDLTPNTMLLSLAKELNIWKQFTRNYKLGNVYYESPKIKVAVNQIIKYLI